MLFKLPYESNWSLGIRKQHYKIFHDQLTGKIYPPYIIGPCLLSKGVKLELNLMIKAKQNIFC